MIYRSMMSFFKFWPLVFLTIVTSCSCSSITLNREPRIQGVDPRVQGIVDNFKEMASKKGLKFNKTVPIGFGHIKYRNVIGLCMYGRGYREIRIDEANWENSTPVSRTMLLYHELAHCYCSRPHDYAEDEEYPEDDRVALIRDLEPKWGLMPTPGHFTDGCPTSIMYPLIVNDACTISHYSSYIKEMYNRCSEW